MSRDLLLGKTKRNWARGASRCLTPKLPDVPAAPVSDEVTLRLTQKEMNLLAQLSAAKLKADSGDLKAAGQVARVAKKLKSVRAKAAKGDPDAKRLLLVLRESGVFRGVKSMSLGDDAAPAGTVSNLDYRIAVLRQATRSAKKRGQKSPTTRDFYQAKTAVDGTMQKAGLSLFLPRSRPARRTL